MKKLINKALGKNNDTFNAKNSLKSKIAILDNSKQLKEIFKKIGIIIGIAIIPIFFLFILIMAIVFMVWHWFWPGGFNHQMVLMHIETLKTLASNNNQVGGLMDDVVKAIEKVIYIVFIHPILWFLNQTTIVVFFIGQGNISKALFKNNYKIMNLPIEYVVCFGVAIGLIGLLFGIKMLLIMGERHQDKGKEFRKTMHNFLFAFVGMILIPLIFFMVNNLITWITNFVNAKTTGSSHNLGLFIFNASFDNGTHHFTYVPDAWNFTDSGHFNYIVCLFAEIFMIYMMILICLNLFTRVFELFLLYVISPIVLVSTVVDSDGSNKHFKNWSELTIQKFLLFTFIFLAFNTFLSTISIFTKIAIAIPSTATRPVFILLGIFGSSLVVTKAPQILNAIVGGQASLMDSLASMTALGNATRAIGSAGSITAGVGFKIASKTPSITSRSFLGKKLENGERKGGLVGHAGKVAGIVSNPIATIKHQSTNWTESTKASASSLGQTIKTHFVNNKQNTSGIDKVLDKLKGAKDGAKK